MGCLFLAESSELRLVSGQDACLSSRIGPAGGSASSPPSGGAGIGLVVGLAAAIYIRIGDAMTARAGLVLGKPACVGTSPLMSDGHLRALRR
jgi:hypothetical protein